MAYIYKNRSEVVEFLTSLEFSCGEDYYNYVYKSKQKTTRFNIFYNGSLSGFVENENLSENSSNVWVIHIPMENRSALEAASPGIVEAIFDEGTNIDGTIDKNYYVDPVGFSRIDFKDSNEKSYVVTAQGPGSTLNAKFESKYITIDRVPMGNNMYQIAIDINSKLLAEQLRYDFADIVTGIAKERVSPESMSTETSPDFPSIVFAPSATDSPKWEPVINVEVGSSRNANNADALGGIDAADYQLKNNLNSDFAHIINDNSYSYGFRALYNSETKEASLYTKTYKINLMGDVSGTGYASNFDNIDIQCRLATRGDTSGDSEVIGWTTTGSIDFKSPIGNFNFDNLYFKNLHKFEDDDGNVVIDIPLGKSYKFKIGGQDAFTIPVAGGNDIVEMFEPAEDFEFEDGDLMGLDKSGKIIPLAKDGIFIGVASKNPAIILGGTKGIPIAICGKKVVKIKIPRLDIIGQKIIADDVNGFRLCSLFDADRDAIVIGNVRKIDDDTVEALVLLK